MTQEESSKIDWLNHALEFFVVVIGILMAFQLENYAEERKQAKTLEAHRYYVAEETKLNKSSVNYALQGAQASLKKTNQILTDLENPELDLNQVNETALKLFIFDYAYIKKNAYSTLTESGDIRFMSFKEKTDIINLYEYYKWIESVQLTNADTHKKVYIQMVREYLDMSGKTLQAPEFYQSKIFKNAVLSYQSGLQYKIRKYQDCIEVIDNFMIESDI